MTAKSNAEDKVPEFGAAIRKEFMLREGTAFLNHGSYGSVPRCVYNRQIKYLEEIEAQAEMFFYYDLNKHLEASVNKVCEILNTSPDDTFLVQNATKGVNTVLRSFPIKEDEAVMISNLTYPAMQHAAKYIGGKMRKLYIEKIESEDHIVKQYDDFLAERPDIKLAIIEHIASQVTVLMPIKRLVEVCHRHNVLVFVDGAHAAGQVKLDLPDIDADFYTGNLYKWMYTPRGCAFLWMNPKRKQAWLKPLIISDNEGLGLVEEFRYEGTSKPGLVWERVNITTLNAIVNIQITTILNSGLPGTKDDTPYFCIVDGINYYNRLGGMDKILAYTTDLRSRGIEYLVKRWGTKRLEIPENMIPPNIQMIYLPNLPGFSDSMIEDATSYSDSKIHLRLQRHLVKRFNVQTAIWSKQGKLVLRLSTNVYVTWGDIVKLGDAIETLAAGK